MWVAQGAGGAVPRGSIAIGKRARRQCEARHAHCAACAACLAPAGAIGATKVSQGLELAALLEKEEGGAWAGCAKEEGCEQFEVN